MIEFLRRALNAQIVITLLAMLSATALRAFDLVQPEIWRDVINTSLLAFVGGGLVKDGITAIANKGQT